jgi:hypothetical protein
VYVLHVGLLLVRVNEEGWTRSIISTFWFRNLMERDHLGDQGVDERTIVKCVVEKICCYGVNCI